MRHIVCAEDSDDNPRMAEIMATGLVLPKSLGGISGAAYFAYGPSSMRLAGIQYEATEDGGYQSAILVARASYLREDGTIDHAALP
jgi:hypothetical protein